MSVCPASRRGSVRQLRHLSDNALTEDAVYLIFGDRLRTFNWANLSAVLARGVASSRSCLEPLNPDQPVNQFNYGLLLLVSLLIFY